MTQRPSFEDVLASDGVLDRDGLTKARSFAQSKGVPLEKAVVGLGLADENRVWRTLSKSAGLPFVDPTKARIGADLLAKVPVDQIQQNQALPVLMKNGVLFVAIDDPVKTFVADGLSFFAGCDVQCALAPPKALQEVIKRVVETGGAAPDRAESRGATGASGRSAKAGGAADDADAPIIRLVEKTIAEAVDRRASDIHVEPFETQLRIRLRVDGVLRDYQQLPRDLLAPLTSRLKILASMDIAEKRKPQDGRIEFRVGGRAIDIRTSVLPSNHGESVVMRLLDKEQNLLSLPALGFEGEDYERFQHVIKRPNGIVLVTGPTGSGKTTTLYAALSQLNRSDVKIITAEDPVEFNIAGINQCQVRSQIGLSFARILRAMLRQAPNVILVGEIRDRETAEIAVQAALTGHLVFSTLHTNDSTSAITRLVDMGVKPFLVSAAVQAVMAQRLVRLLCTHCKREGKPNEIELRQLGLDPAQRADTTIWYPVGCEHCEGSGYRGRLGIFELMRMDEELREMTFRGTPAVKLREYARQSAGMSVLAEDGARKVLAGKTSLEELLRVTAAV